MSRRILIHTPQSPGAQVDTLALGLQHWWADKLVALGGDAASCIQTEPHPEHPGMKRLGAGKPWTPAQLRQQILSAGRYALTSAFVPGLRGSAKLREARLIEAARGRPGVRTIGAWKYEGQEAEVVTDAFAVLTNVAPALNLPIPYDDWTDAFGTDDLLAAAHYLRALGSYSVMESEVYLPAPGEALTLLHQALSASPDMGSAIHLLPKLVSALRAQPDITAAELHAGVERAIEVVGSPFPAAWHGLTSNRTTH